jgi:hypothetical protein
VTRRTRARTSHDVWPVHGHGEGICRSYDEADASSAERREQVSGRALMQAPTMLGQAWGAASMSGKASAPPPRMRAVSTRRGLHARDHRGCEASRTHCRTGPDGGPLGATMAAKRRWARAVLTSVTPAGRCRAYDDDGCRHDHHPTAARDRDDEGDRGERKPPKSCIRGADVRVSHVHPTHEVPVASSPGAGSLRGNGLYPSVPGARTLTQRTLSPLAVGAWTPERSSGRRKRRRDPIGPHVGPPIYGGRFVRRRPFCRTRPPQPTNHARPRPACSIK